MDISMPTKARAPPNIRTLVPFPAPIAALPPSGPEPLLSLSAERREALIAAALERRRQQIDSGSAFNRVVYDSMVFVPPSADRVPGGALLFESRFESGNLRRAVHVSGNEYDLLLSWDHGTRGHTQWFFFAVIGARAGESYCFNIVNFCKPQSLYKHGMQPLMYSAKAAAEGTGWRRVGNDVVYYENGVHRRDREKGSHSTLSFSWEASASDDVIYFAMCYPYTYTTLRNYLTGLMGEPRRGQYLRRQRLALTIAGNECEAVWLTDHASSAEEINARPVVVVSARVHPGESNASWMMHGILDFLTSDAPEATALRRRVLFLIVPMLNPDGVIVGNYRCSLAAADLNRRWAKPSSRLHPTVHALKRLLLRLQARQSIAMYVDLHGHSRKQHVFMYGCAEAHPRAERRAAANCTLQQVFPLLISKEDLRGYFHFRSCNYAVKRGKESTGRVVLHRELSLLTSYTLEASFCGFMGPATLRDGRRAAAREAADEDSQTSAAEDRSRASPEGFHFNTDHLQQIGVQFCLGLWHFFGLAPPGASHTAASLSNVRTRDSSTITSTPSLADEEEVRRRHAGGLQLSAEEWAAGRDIRGDWSTLLPDNPSVRASLEYLLAGGATAALTWARRRHQAKHRQGELQDVAAEGGMGWGGSAEGEEAGFAQCDRCRGSLSGRNLAARPPPPQRRHPSAVLAARQQRRICPFAVSVLMWRYGERQRSQRSPPGKRIDEAWRSSREGARVAAARAGTDDDDMFGFLFKSLHAPHRISYAACRAAASGAAQRDARDSAALSSPPREGELRPATRRHSRGHALRDAPTYGEADGFQDSEEAHTLRSLAPPHPSDGGRPAHTRATTPPTHECPPPPAACAAERIRCSAAAGTSNLAHAGGSATNLRSMVFSTRPRPARSYPPSSHGADPQPSNAHTTLSAWSSIQHALLNKHAAYCTHARAFAIAY
ncbi:hypothetical protein AB1Y20_001747 [Prymnesium parvum]|uniref:Peptidase M14 domain-containing protein n=1 Tax=Prymnesium parvum TaxID=97485 RepID=A0AB34K8M5_PRYPA